MIVGGQAMPNKDSKQNDPNFSGMEVKQFGFIRQRYVTNHSQAYKPQISLAPVMMKS